MHLCTQTLIRYLNREGVEQRKVMVWLREAFNTRDLLSGDLGPRLAHTVLKCRISLPAGYPGSRLFVKIYVGKFDPKDVDVI